jgi:hypothetical protein
MLRQLRTIARLSIQALHDLAYSVPYAGPVVAFLAARLLLVRQRRIGLERLLFVAGVAFLLLRTWFRIWDAIPPWDFQIFYAAGRAVLDGRDPYANRELVLMYAPNSLSLFELFAMISFRTVARLWLGFNVVALISVLLFCRSVFPAGAYSLGRRALPLAVAACVLLSDAATFGLDAGQMCVWTVVWVYAALWCRSRGRPLLAGVCLAPGAIKIATMIPFLLLFLRRQDRLTWVGTAVAGLGLCLLSSSPAELVTHSRSCLQNMQMLLEPGMFNDYSFAGPFHDDVIAFNHWAYCLGLRDRTVIAVLQMTLVLVLGALLLTDFYLRRTPPDLTIQYSLVCVFSCLFLYHRMYDTIILAIPLLHCSDRARQETGWRRAAYALTVIGFLLILNMPRGKPLHELADWSEGAALPGRIVQVVVLPYAVWVLLLALAVIRFGERTAVSGPAEQALAGEGL